MRLLELLCITRPKDAGPLLPRSIRIAIGAIALAVGVTLLVAAAFDRTATYAYIGAVLVTSGLVLQLSSRRS